MMVMLDAFVDLCLGTLYLLVLGVFYVGLMFFTEWILNRIEKHR